MSHVFSSQEGPEFFLSFETGYLSQASLSSSLGWSEYVFLQLARLSHLLHVRVCLTWLSQHLLAKMAAELGFVCVGSSQC